MSDPNEPFITPKGEYQFKILDKDKNMLEKLGYSEADITQFEEISKYVTIKKKDGK